MGKSGALPKLRERARRSQIAPPPPPRQGCRLGDTAAVAEDAKPAFGRLAGQAPESESGLGGAGFHAAFAPPHPEPHPAVPGVPACPRQRRRARLLPQVSPPRSFGARHSVPPALVDAPACPPRPGRGAQRPSGIGALRHPAICDLRGAVRSRPAPPRPAPPRAGVTRHAWCVPAARPIVISVNAASAPSRVHS